MKLPEKLNFPKLKYNEIEITNCNIFPKGEIYVWNSMAFNKVPKDKSLTACFFVEDERFSSLLRSSKKALNNLQGFKYVMQPDYSVYFDLPLVDQIYRTWVGKSIAYTWQVNGLKIIPNLTLGSKELFDFAVYGIPANQSFVVQIQANNKSIGIDKIDEKTIKDAIELIQPKNVFVYGTEKRMQLLNLKETNVIKRINTNINSLRGL